MTIDTEIPDWAMKMAREEAAEMASKQGFNCLAEDCRNGLYDQAPIMQALAARIANTEQPPMDPIEQDFREALACLYDAQANDHDWRTMLLNKHEGAALAAYRKYRESKQ